MAVYIYSVKATRYGTPTGTNTMPALTALPNNVKGSITLDEGDPSFTSIFEEQAVAPLRRIQTAAGDVSFKCQYHDMTYAAIAALKGGSAVGAATGYQAPTNFADVNKAFQVEFDSGQYFNYYNAAIAAKIVGSGARDGYIDLDLTVMPQLSADGKGIWEIKPVV